MLPLYNLRNFPDFRLQDSIDASFFLCLCNGAHQLLRKGSNNIRILIFFTQVFKIKWWNFSCLWFVICVSLMKDRENRRCLLIVESDYLLWDVGFEYGG